MNNILSTRIDSLPPLPKTIIELEKFKKSDEKELNVLLEIIDKDPLVVATLLKVVNSAMFGFNNRVETVSRALHLLGSNFTLSIAFGSSIKQAFKTDLKAYGIDADGFIKIANISSNLLSLWLGRIDNKLKEELLLPLFLLETGRFILSSIAIDNKQCNAFLKDIKDSPLDISNIEREYFDTTSSEVTSSIFKYWNFTESLVKTIEFTDNLENCPEEYLKKAQTLNVIKTICNVSNPLSDIFIEEGLKKASLFGLNIKYLEKAIDTIENRISVE